MAMTNHQTLLLQPSCASSQNTNIEDCSLHSGRWLTGACGVGGVAVSAVEATLAGANIGSSCTGATVGWAGGAESLPKFGFEGSRDASWMGGRKKTKTKKTMRTKTRMGLSFKTQDAVTSEQKLHLRRSILMRKTLIGPWEMANTSSHASYLYICMCSSLFTPSTRWQ